MTKLMIDAKTASQLKNSTAPVFLCDPSGEVVGRVVPPSQYDRLIVPFTEDEIRAAEDDATEFTLAEILADLEKRGHGADLPSEPSCYNAVTIHPRRQI
jgi:hypothetical protein